MNTLEQWVDAVCRELDITDAVAPTAMQTRILDISRDVAHTVARPAAPLTAYLIGLAAGRTGDPEAAADALTSRIRLLTQRWGDPDPHSAG
ncbi:MAG: DUF6457 domain-containing protein [Pseudonocardiaceae bacterium]